MSKKNLILTILIIATITFVFIFIYYYFAIKIDKNVDIYLYDESKKENDETIPAINNNDIEDTKIKPIKTNVVIPIFMYHFVTDDTVTAWDKENYMTTTKLEEQFKYIKENFYEPVFISELDDLSSYTKPVAITIDDGFLFYDTTFQLIKKYRIKATLSVIVNYINGPDFLTSEQIKEIRDSGLVEIQSHTLSHQKLATLSYDKMKEELVKSQELLKNDYNIESNVICYPIGSYNRNVINEAKKIYKFGLKMDGGIYDSTKDNFYEISRIYVNRSMSMNTFINYLNKSKVVNIW